MVSIFEYQGRLFKIYKDTGCTWELKGCCWVMVEHKTEFTPNYAVPPWVCQDALIKYRIK